MKILHVYLQALLLSGKGCTYFVSKDIDIVHWEDPE